VFETGAVFGRHSGVRSLNGYGSKPRLHALEVVLLIENLNNQYV
jgi:hypothetical protein